MNRILYVSYGDGPHVLEAALSVYSLQRWVCVDHFEVVVVTDMPEFFSRLPVHVVSVDSATVDRWAGPVRLAHRRKIEALRLEAERTSGRVILIDADTVWERDPMTLFERIDDRHCVMHMPEGRLSDSRWEANRRAASHVPSGGQTVQWNSGVVGIRTQDLPLLESVLELVDRILGKEWLPIAEQLAFSAVLGSNRVLREARPWVYHYCVHPQRELFRRRLMEHRSALSRFDSTEELDALLRSVPRPAPRRRMIIAIRDALDRLQLTTRRDRTGCF